MTYVRSRFAGVDVGEMTGIAESLGEDIPGVGSVVGAISSVLGSSGNGSGEPDGSPQDPRIVDLNGAYNQALAGNVAGWTYLQTWIHDSPPHPDYSNSYADTLAQILTDAGVAPGSTGTPTITAYPATASTSPTNPPQTAPYAGGGGLFSSKTLPLLAGGAALAAAVGFFGKRR